MKEVPFEYYVLPRSYPIMGGMDKQNDGKTHVYVRKKKRYTVLGVQGNGNRTFGKFRGNDTQVQRNGKAIHE